MQKNRFVLLAVFAILLVTTIIVVITNSKSTFTKEEGFFAVSDTANITSITIADKYGHKTNLQRYDNQWYVNEQTLAYTEMTSALIKVIHDIDKTKVVAKSDIDNIKENIQNNGIEITIFNKKRVVKNYSILLDNKKQICYGLLSKSKKPFIIEVPGFNQLISILTIADPFNWKSRTILAINAHNIAQVIYIDNKNESNSFVLKNDNGRFKVMSYPLGIEQMSQNNEKIARFLNQFKRKEFSALPQLMSTTIDSIVASKPLYTLSVNTTDGREFGYKAFLKQNDNNNFYLQLSSGDFVQGKYYDFDPIVKTLSYFSE